MKRRDRKVPTGRVSTRRILGMLTVLAALMATTPTVSAGIDSSVEFRFAPEGSSDSEVRNWTPRPGEVQGTYRVDAAAGAQSSIRTLTVQVQPDPSETSIPPLGPEATKTQSYAATENKTSALIELVWDSATLTPYNGMYRLVATVDSQLGDPASASVTHLLVNNPPARPTGVKSRVDGSNVPVITWSPNQEPDLIGYEVTRQVGNKDEVRIATTEALSYKDTKAPKDVSLRYRIYAVRHSPETPTTGIKAGSLPTSAITIHTPSESGGSTRTLPPPPPSVAPPPLRVAPVVGPRRDLGFDPLLPYQAPIPQRYAQPDIPDNPVEALADPTRLVQGRVHTPPFVGAALLMLVLALHLARISRNLLSG